jgi:RanBP-type and C3HC4-type zinc finger-containing protein 1
MRPSTKNKSKNKTARTSSIYEDVDVGQSYENFNDNPVLEKSKKISRMVTKHDKDYALPSKINKPKIIPPRTSQDPIPTPRKSSLTRSRNQSTESINRINSLTRETHPKKEPYYKVPPPNPKLVNPNDHHFYSEPLYEEDQQITKRDNQSDPRNIQKERDSNQNIKKSNVSKSNKSSGSQKSLRKGPEKRNVHPDKQDTSRPDESRIKSPPGKQDQNIPPNLKSKQKIRKTSTDLETRTNNDTDTRVEVELSEADDRFYDTKEEQGAVLIKKSKGVATLPNGSKYPCVIVQRKAKKEGKSESKKPNTAEKNIEEIPPKKAERKVKDYIPTEMPFKPDWFDDLKIKKESKTARPTSIIDGVLYTSKALIDSDSKSKKLGTFNLIEPEVFEMYDVCKNQTVKDPQRHTIEDAHMQPPRTFHQQDSYENTDPPAETSNFSYPVYPPDNFDTRPPAEFKKTSADNPFRCKSSQSSVHDETEAATNKGVDTFKALLVGQGEGPSGDLLMRLEEAISKGDHKYAASLAKDLAKLKISSRLTEQESDDKKSRPDGQAVKLVKANMFVEDAVSAQGPITVEVNPAITVADLKLQIEKEFEIPVNVQKWILGKNLVSEDTITLHSQGVDVDGAQIFLYLVNPAEREAELAKTEAEPQELPKPSPPAKIPLVLPTEPFQKGRYWNYEEDRWSFCNSDDDDEREVEVKQMGTEKKDEPAGEAAGAVANEDDEWEYYYEDVDMKAKENAEKPKPAAAQIPEQPKPKANNFLFIGKAEDQKPAELKAAAGPSATAAKDPPKAVEPKVNGWECPVCTLVNPMERPGCVACTTERPADLGAAAAAPENTAAPANKEKPKEEKKNNLDAYKQLENLDIIPNAENFECTVCFLDTEPGDGVVLRECLHTFCKICLAASIEHSDAPKVKCPFKDDNYSCDMELLEREIKALVSPAVFEKHQKKGMKEAEANIQNTFHCKTPDCAGWTVTEDDVNIFKCPLCKRTNCITCQAIHDGMDCKQYQQYMLVDSQDENSKKTKEWMDDLITKGEALHCPSCQVLLLKKWGCDWVRCTYCRTEICWVTRQLRWGPNGRGDTSGGCKCMIDGRTKCHKNCNYCH